MQGVRSVDEFLDEDRAQVLAEGPLHSAPLPALWEVGLPETSSADLALEDVLLGLIDGEESRAGEALSSFGIRWVVVTGDTPLEAVFDGQLDLVSLGGAKRPTFLVDTETPVRAIDSTGATWSRAGTGYAGEPASGERVLVSETANARWGPGPWAQSEWANEVSAADGAAFFDPIEGRRGQATIAAAVFLLYVLLSAVARRRR